MKDVFGQLLNAVAQSSNEPAQIIGGISFLKAAVKEYGKEAMITALKNERLIIMVGEDDCLTPDEAIELIKND